MAGAVWLTNLCSSLKPSIFLDSLLAMLLRSCSMNLISSDFPGLARCDCGVCICFLSYTVTTKRVPFCLLQHHFPPFIASNKAMAPLMSARTVPTFWRARLLEVVTECHEVTLASHTIFSDGRGLRRPFPLTTKELAALADLSCLDLRWTESSMHALPTSACVTSCVPSWISNV